MAPTSLGRRVALWLALLVAALVIGGCLTVGLSAFLWSRMEPSEIELTNVAPAELAEKTTLKGVPPTATHIRYVSRGWQDTETFLYFQAPRSDVDAFSKQLTGNVAADYLTRQRRGRQSEGWVTEQGSSAPPPKDFPLPPLPELPGPGRLERDWWLPFGAKVPRSEGTDDNRVGVFVVDHDSYSEVWAYINPT